MQALPSPADPGYPSLPLCPEALDILALIREGVLVFDRSGRVRYLNPAFSRIFRLAPEAVGAALAGLFPPGTGIGDLVADALAGRTATDCDVASGRGEEEGEPWLRVSTAPIGRSGSDLLMLAVREVSELRRLEREIWQVEKMSALGRLAASVAHEVRNPLSAVDIQLQLLEEDLGRLGQEVPPRVTERLNTAHTEMRRLDGIVQNFLRFSGPPAIHLQWVDPNELLKHLHALVAPEAREQRIALSLDLGGGLPQILADENLLSQALLNVLINAFQAVDEAPRVELRSRLDAEGDHVLFQVVDNGCGIPPENLERVMEYYYTTKDTGTGLGLSIAQGILRQHRGSVDVQSQVAAGTTVTLALPCSARPS
ncbi:MAG: ATP-binding protein [Gemmatimonadota bacterium]